MAAQEPGEEDPMRLLDEAVSADGMLRVFKHLLDAGRIDDALIFQLMLQCPNLPGSVRTPQDFRAFLEKFNESLETPPKACSCCGLAGSVSLTDLGACLECTSIYAQMTKFTERGSASEPTLAYRCDPMKRAKASAMAAFLESHLDLQVTFRMKIVENRTKSVTFFAHNPTPGQFTKSAGKEGEQ